MSSRLTLKNINELCVGENGELFDFYIPSYQRGYGQRLAYTNALAIILEACTIEYTPDDEHDKNN